MFNVQISGRFTKDPELGEMKDGTQVCNFTLANNDYRSNHVNWINCSAYGKKAEFICNNFSKGDLVVVDGTGLNKEDKKDEKINYYFSVKVDEIIFPTSKKDSTEEEMDVTDVI